MDKVREAVQFLRCNKVCGQRRTQGSCDHPGCRLAVEYAEAIEALIEETVRAAA